MDKQLFGSSRGPAADTTNYAGGRAYALDSEEALAQYAATCMFGSTFYAEADEQLDQVLKHAAACNPVFVAKAAVYARERNWLKDVPVVLLAHLSTRFAEAGARSAFRAAFPRVVDNGKMLRNFCQVIASNAVGRQNFGHTLRGVIQAWFDSRHPDQWLQDSVGGDNPSMGDVLKMTRTCPRTDADRALRAYIIGRKLSNSELSLLPERVQHYEAFKHLKSSGEHGDAPVSLPRVDFRLLDSLGLTADEWKQIARNAKWQMTRMNLNTFQRHGVFEDKEMVQLIAARLADKKLVEASRNYPFQLFQAFRHAQGVPHEIRNALQDAADHSTYNIPEFAGKNIVICQDVSSSMTMKRPVGGRTDKKTGRKTGGVMASEAAGLFTAAMLRKNPGAMLLPFSDRLNTTYRCNTRDSLMTIAQQLASLPSGGTDCSLPLSYLNGMNEKHQAIQGVDLVIFVSDDESWIERIPSSYGFYGSGRSPTSLMVEWSKLKLRNPQAKLVCIDMTPSPTTQAPNAPDRLNVGGFSDHVFDVIKAFVDNGKGSGFVDAIKAVDLDAAIKRE